MVVGGSRRGPADEQLRRRLPDLHAERAAGREGIARVGPPHRHREIAVRAHRDGAQDVDFRKELDEVASRRWARLDPVAAVGGETGDLENVQDVVHVFQVTGLTADGRYWVKPSPATAGDFIEFFAEIDVLCAISVCPHGDLSVPVWGPNAGDPLATCRPLGVEIWEPAPELLVGWAPPRPSDYHGGHGLTLRGAATEGG